MPNRLANETSPYLLQHSHNPVDWHPWGEAALERARAEQKPILLSIGYSACHWCHVMERESFENEAIAALMNERFVCVKVDREERPDLDHLYMTAVQAMAGQGGWPLTVFLTPEGEPFFGGTYYPPVDLHGRPGFPRVLKAVSDAWTERRSSVLEQSADMVRFIRRSSEAALPPAPVTPDLFSTAFRQLRQAYDRRHGGFGGAPKFPQPMLIDFLLRHHLGTGSQDALEMAVKTLESMALGGIRDQLGGGFHRYSTDERWLVPHFEKMLYDNAQLAQSYLRAWQVTGRPLFRRVAEETLDYVRREMTSPFGGFYSAQDADSEGEEGRFFVWTVEEIEQELGEDAAGFCRRYGVEPGGNWEGKSILTMSDHSDDSDPLDAELQSGRERLFAARERRVRPFRDEKVLASWNGLMLAAFAEAGAVLGRADYLQTARNNAEFLLRELAVSSEDGGLKLLRTGKATFVENPADPAGRSETFRAGPIPGFLDDYAHLADALLHLYQATGEAKWLQGASALAKTIVADFSGPDGAFYLTPSGGEELIGRPRDVTDNAIPSGNSVALEVLLKLSGILGNTEMERIASRILRSLRGLMERNPLAFGRLLGVADLYVLPRRQLVVAGEEQGGETLLAVARETYRPNLFVVPCGSQGGAAVAESKSAIAGRAAAYLCQDGTCRAPILEPQELREALANP